MVNRSRRPLASSHLQNVELIPITDPVQQAALDRLFRSGRISKEDRSLLMDQAEKKKSPQRPRKR